MSDGLGDDHDGIDVEEAAEHLLADALRDRASGIASEKRPALLEAMGGPLGIVESAVPSLAFVIAATAGQSIKTSAIIAVSLAIPLALARAVRRQTIQFAVTGVVGVAFSAWVASHTGEARNFFIPGFALNVLYGSICFISVAIKRPFVGYFVEGLAGGQGNWRENPDKMRRFQTASLLWGSIFVLRLMVQIPLYLADKLVWLGTVKIAMGYPLFGIAIWLTWRLVRAPKTGAEDDPAPA